MTTLADLEKENGFVSDQPVPKTIEWDRTHLGKKTLKVKVFVRPMNVATFERISTALPGTAKLPMKIAALATFGEHGDEIISEERASLMDMNLVVSINRAIDELSAAAGKA